MKNKKYLTKNDLKEKFTYEIGLNPYPPKSRPNSKPQGQQSSPMNKEIKIIDLKVNDRFLWDRSNKISLRSPPDLYTAEILEFSPSFQYVYIKWYNKQNIPSMTWEKCSEVKVFEKLNDISLNKGT